MNLSNGWPMMGSTGEIILFACTAIVMVACALGVLFFKKAAHSVICMVGVMLGLAVLYIANSAPFLGVAQIVVYTGAIMMLFLIMLIGIGTSDDYARQSRGAIVAAVLGGLGLIVIVTTAILKAVPAPHKPVEVDPYSNQPITDLAITLFQEHWLSMELAGGLLITAAVGAMLLTHSDRLTPKADQFETARNKMRAFAEKGARIGQLPAPGVYAQSNAADVPAVSGETLGPVEESVPRPHDRRGHPGGLRAARPRAHRDRGDRRDRRVALHHRAHARRPPLRRLRHARRGRAHWSGPAPGPQGAHHHPH